MSTQAEQFNADAQIHVGPPRTTTSATSLRADHDALEDLTHSVMKKVIAGRREGLAEAIGELQARVLAHLDSEERDVLPRYAEYAPQDASELLAEHATMRSVLAELDVAVDLHFVRANALDAFLATLRTHAIRENAGLYRWAERTGGT